MTAVAIAAAFLLLSSVPLVRSIAGGDTRPFVIDTVLMAAAVAVAIAAWPQGGRPGDRPFGVTRRARALTPVVAAVGLALLIYACREWIAVILHYPIDAYRADMLVVVQDGIRRVLQGRNPYTIYHVPWDAPLPYGPMLWAPYVLPYAVGADIRFVAVGGALFMPCACAIAAAVAAMDGDWIGSAALLVLTAVVALSAELANFLSIGHTPSYWPLLALFAWLVVRRSWTPAAAALGLLIVARTTMVAIAPVYLMAVWMLARPMFARSVALLSAAAILPFAPFAIVSWHALAYALYGSYQSVMKGFVWASTTWVQHTIGVTGVLLAHGWTRWIEPVQFAALAATYAIAWRALRAGAAPLAWMVAALFVFSLTTLWPVGYIYFDVLLLAIAGLVAESRFVARDGSAARLWLLCAGLACVLVAASAFVMLPSKIDLDVGTPTARPALAAGFSVDDAAEGRTFVWVDGRGATILLPRRTRADAAIDIVCEPFVDPGQVQDVSAVLNGVAVGTARVADGWHTIEFAAPARAWRIGVNQLQLFMSVSAGPGDPSLHGDTRSLSLAIDRVTVR